MATGPHGLLFLRLLLYGSVALDSTFVKVSYQIGQQQGQMQNPTTAPSKEAAGLDRLVRIGEDMDRDNFPRIGANGSVVSGTGCSPYVNPPEKECTEDGRRQAGPAGSEGPAAGQRQGAAGPGSARPQAAQASILDEAGLTRDVESDLEEAFAEYRPVRLRVASGVAWILFRLHPVTELPDRALLLVLYPLDRRSLPRAWAWWDTGVWIGPRHTNVPDGSICAYAEGGWIWRQGDPLLGLLDLYAGWILRHLHLRRVGRWPGGQEVNNSYERWLEQQPDELCGCGSERRYRDCHRPHDAALSPVERYLDFVKAFGTSCFRRRPPPEVYTTLCCCLKP